MDLEPKPSTTRGAEPLDAFCTRIAGIEGCAHPGNTLPKKSYIERAVPELPRLREEGGKNRADVMENVKVPELKK